MLSKTPVLRFYKALLPALLFILYAGKSSATHYYGVDLFYTHVSGNTYRVTLVAFGDCSGQQFPTFATTRPRILIRRGNTADSLTDLLEPESPRQGIEVTPVCPAELNNTTCVNPTGTVPGVKKFVYSKEFTLSGPDTNWQFIWQGLTDGSVIGGRSNSLTNVSTPGVINVVATLDNTKYSNSSPVYTTIATPFYCVNKSTNFNPGAIDADGDSLVYELVPGLNPVDEVTYLPGFTGANPLDVVPGKFSFNRSTGQLSFTPGVLQRSLVVYRVHEYRAGKLIGTSMREMTVVIMQCDNNAPGGYISDAENAVMLDSVTVKTCKGSQDVAFDIDPTDADSGHTINMVANGLPKEAKLNISNNNTTQPHSRFVWNVKDAAEGDYTFYVTYTDNGCPLASKQVQAYTIRLVGSNISCETIAAGCTSLGHIRLRVVNDWQPWGYKVYRDQTVIQERKNITASSWGDSLVEGTYRLEAVNNMGCAADTTVTIPYTCDIADLPNAFSPNGDGVNDMLYVIGMNVREMDFKIYNRWGQVVFVSHDVKKGWDGKFNGQNAPIEAYAYTLSVLFKTGNTFQKKGNISLLR